MKAPAAAVVQELVLANHILHAQGVVDGFGHVSRRHPDNASHFLLSRSRAPALVEAADIGVYDLEGRPLAQVNGAPYLERFIHSEIYRARPDVMAIVHSHSASVIPFGVTGQRLRPIFHMAGFLGSGSAHFEIRDAVGDSDLLVSTPALGRALATSLGACSCALMRGHGSTVVGHSLQQAVFRAVYTEVNARMQATAMALGPVTYLSPNEAERAATANDGQIGRTWALWAHALKQTPGQGCSG
ncbi:class II aldolase/adducin family protein [Pantoea sp. 18069]|uniref:class II aldolase/adducin family protein n=1 Tax=Pantoea sp. 18069 TaxID=2681415 RepID=UPI001357086B|nr:class II aldolase/adducin family protein [Pantoea sp. 18069]